MANIEELLTDARQFDEQHVGEGYLEAFLEQACLVNDVDDWDVDTDKVTLMTLHAAKGLEFPVVFIIAMEDGLLPHERSRNEPAQLEEERRLLFVGVTRACEELCLSRAVYREFRGQRRRAIPSSFLMELPLEEMELAESSWQETIWEEPSRASRTVKETPTAESFAPAAVMTAADLVGDPCEMSEAVDPDVFCQGMAVSHPEYGLGKVVALSGAGTNRKATVAFATAGQKKFVLSSSPLRPARMG